MIVAIEQIQGVGYQPPHGPARVFPGYGVCVPADVERVVKSQRVRVADVLLIGPLMAWGGAKLAPRYPVAGGLLALLGVATVLYNGRNYLTVRDALTGA
jgi:hypothetical protein